MAKDPYRQPARRNTNRGPKRMRRRPATPESPQPRQTSQPTAAPAAAPAPARRRLPATPDVNATGGPSLDTAPLPSRADTINRVRTRNQQPLDTAPLPDRGATIDRVQQQNRRVAPSTPEARGPGAQQPSAPSPVGQGQLPRDLYSYTDLGGRTPEEIHLPPSARDGATPQMFDQPGAQGGQPGNVPLGRSGVSIPADVLAAPLGASLPTAGPGGRRPPLTPESRPAPPQPTESAPATSRAAERVLEGDQREAQSHATDAAIADELAPQREADAQRQRELEQSRQRDQQRQATHDAEMGDRDARLDLNREGGAIDRGEVPAGAAEHINRRGREIGTQAATDEYRQYRELVDRQRERGRGPTGRRGAEFVTSDDGQTHRLDGRTTPLTPESRALDQATQDARSEHMEGFEPADDSLTPEEVAEHRRRMSAVMDATSAERSVVQQSEQQRADAARERVTGRIQDKRDAQRDRNEQMRETRHQVRRDRMRGLTPEMRQERDIQQMQGEQRGEQADLEHRRQLERDAAKRTPEAAPGPLPMKDANDLAEAVFRGLDIGDTEKGAMFGDIRSVPGPQLLQYVDNLLRTQFADQPPERQDQIRDQLMVNLGFPVHDDQ